MATARMTNPAPIGLVNSTSNIYTGDGIASVDEYATRVLKMTCPPEASVDESLGPYITSLLRSQMQDAPEFNGNVAGLPEYESLMELLEEHCNVSAEVALNALQTITMAVRTGVVDDYQRSWSRRSGTSANGTVGYDRSPWSTSLGSKGHEKIEPLSLLNDGWHNPAEELEPTGSHATFRLDLYANDKDKGSSTDDFEKNDDRSVSSGTAGGTPLKPDRLIPVDLMGVLDNPSTPTGIKRYKIEAFSFPETGDAEAQKESIDKKQLQDDLASSLFSPALAHQNEVQSEAKKSPTLSATSEPFTSPQFASFVPSEDPYYTQEADAEYYQQQQFMSSVEMLLSMNKDLGEDAATAAVLLANADVNVAQYLVDAAKSAPPVCRHLLNDGCYRSDCQFSHDIEGHTCLFWLRGRCGKLKSCRFRHGFDEKLLDGVDVECLKAGSDEEVTSYGAKSDPLPIKTTNLVEHNATQSFSAPQQSFMSYAFEESAATYPPHNYPQDYQVRSWEPWESSVNSLSINDSKDNSTSFASVAAKGYSGNESFAFDSTSPQGTVSATTRNQRNTKIQIPKDLWNPHINRNSDTFQIQDPMDRYRAVAASVSRDDVIDLHFQSTRTFQTVLSSVLPEKLASHEAVWVVTGTGHHVGSKTHQKGGGLLEAAVSSWLETEEYNFFQGRDRNGHGGAFLVKR